MAVVRVLVLRAPGTNCDEETQFAFELAGAAVERLHLNRVLEDPRALARFQILCFPGGFSYGDDLAAGRIFANLLKRRLIEPLQAFRDAGGLILGICNGFQVLLQTGLLIEPAADGTRRATLAPNERGSFIDRWVYLRFIPGSCPFVREEAVLEMPVAHGEGNFIAAEGVLDDLAQSGRIVARYVSADGGPASYPANPNGSMGDVAGICDSTGRIFALMPHPERHLFPWQHPSWTRRLKQPQEGDGLSLFRNAVAHFQ